MNEDILIKRYTERAAMMIFCAANITLSLKKHHKPASFEVYDTKKAKNETIFAKSVNDLRLWRKGFEKKGIEDVDCSSFDTVKIRVEAQQDFLLHDHPGKYHLIRDDQDTQTLYDMLLFSAIIRTTEQRFTEGRINDPEVRQRVAIYLSQRENNIGMAKAVGHARKHDEDVIAAIDTVYRESLDNSAGVITSIWTEQLPLLPAGTSHALSWCGLAG